jgi:muramoyltetrapeptide carboxypeptidase LdcA involved in peptidoglycan recycling
LALQKWNNYGINVVFSEHCKEIDEFDSSTITSRIDDLHNAFENKEIDAIFTAIGGYNSNQLLKYVDYNLISLNPKILC